MKKTIEIVASVSAVIPTGNYENFKPMYSIKEISEYDADFELMDTMISNRTDELRAMVNKKLDGDYDRAKIERIKRTRSDIRLYPRGNKDYPSVTSINSAIEPIDFDPDKLKQYASRGTIVHKQIEHWFKTKVWEEDILKIPETKQHYMIVTQGSLDLKWTDCSFMGFWDKHGKDFTEIQNEQVVYNDEHQYAGTADLPCMYKGIKTISDFKTGAVYDAQKLSKYWRQLSAYAKCLGAEQMMVIPLNPKNKCGFGAPIVSDKIDYYFNLFLQDRESFRDIYGI